MKWYIISGTWREVHPTLEQMVTESVDRILAAGDGIVSGGAAGVDYLALHEALRRDPGAERIRILIPGTKEAYFAHLRDTGPKGLYTTAEAAEPLIRQLTELWRRNPNALFEHPSDREIDQAVYFERDTAEVACADALVAFPVRSEFGPGNGTWDTIRKAQRRGLPVFLHPFDYSRYEP